MGSGSSRLGSAPDSRNRSQNHRWPKVKRTVSSILLCGASSSRSANEMKEYPTGLRVHSAEHAHREKMKFPRSNSCLSLSSRTDLISINTENGFSSGTGVVSSENRAQEVGPSNVEPVGKEKVLSESRELVPSSQNAANSRDNQIASTSYLDQPSPDCVSANEVVDKRESLPDEVPVENNSPGATDFNSHRGFHELRNDTLQDVIPPGLGFIVSEREQNRQDGSLLQVDVLGVSPNILNGNSAEISSRDIRRNSRRLFWDAFSRRGSRRHTDSRTFIFSPDNSDNLRSRDRWFLDFDGDLLNDEVGVDFRSQESRIRGSNEQQWNSRPEIWERLRGSNESTDHRNATCPRGIHVGGRCLCQPSLSAVESGARAGISRIVMLAEALFEVLDQIHRQPMSLSLSVVSLPAPESVVDSFPVKTHIKSEKLERADDVSQCYICLSEYEEGDKIRVLPCYHEYHVSCVDKWLKEIHGVCPLCRGDVRDGLTETHVQIE